MDFFADHDDEHKTIFSEIILAKDVGMIRRHETCDILCCILLLHATV